MPSLRKPLFFGTAAVTGSELSPSLILSVDVVEMDRGFWLISAPSGTTTTVSGMMVSEEMAPGSKLMWVVGKRVRKRWLAGAAMVLPSFWR